MMQAIAFLLLSVFILFSEPASAQRKMVQDPSAKFKAEAIQVIQGKYEDYKKIALQIWDFAELGYKEQKSSALLQQTLRDNGFSVEAGMAGIPTAFVASFGNGKPVIGILAEFDALPGLSQEAVPEHKPIEGKNAGHGCGHHLFGTASVAAGIELKNLMEKYKWAGTIRVYGTPAEEGGSGKVYMVREGLFNGVDIVLHWHPGNENTVDYSGALANISAKFRFHGIAAHASAAPERGRSALDGVEAMDNMVNMMREHVPSNARIHYVITNGGKAPNVVPDFAEVYYYARHPHRDEVKQIFERISRAADGAAMGTGTTVDHEIIGGTYDILLNKTLADDVQLNLEKVGGISYNADELEFGKKIQESLGFTAPALDEASKIKPLHQSEDALGSTDVGDVSWNVPTIGFSTATWIPGTPAHSWQAVACGGTDIGIKGMMTAAKTLALTGIDILRDATLVEKAKTEFQQLRGSNFVYKPLLGDRKPALNYRD